MFLHVEYFNQFSVCLKHFSKIQYYMDQLSHIDEYQIPQLVSEVEDISLS